jgi:hypothetical protein
MANRDFDSEDDFLRMQQEAINRVREMQKRARLTLENAGMHIESTSDFPDETPRASSQQSSAPNTSPAHTSASAAHDSRPQEPSRPQQAPHSGNHTPFGTPASGIRRESANEKSEFAHDGERNLAAQNPILSSLHGLNLSLDSDQLLLLLLIYLLSTDGADKWLILSLAYVMLT